MGYLYVLIGSNRHTVIANSQVDTPYIALAGLMLISILGFAIGAYLLVKRSLLNPIEEVTDKLQQQAEQDFRLDPNFVHQVPELVPIARSYQLMAKHIQQQFLQLEYQSSHRRQSMLQLSHDLKTPLSSVLGYLETWKIQNPQSDPLIDVAYRNGNKLSEQLHSLLDSAKQDNPLPTYQYASIDFNTLMTECLETMQSQYVQKGVELEVNLPDGIKAVGDSHLLERLILNLLDNALRHSPTGTAVSLSVDLEPDSKRVRVVIHNEVEREAPNGSLGIGTKIAQSILMLHHSVLETTKAENSFQQSFYLPSV